ncbi:MAG TPA: SCO family protein [Polyangiaceae bacterium]|nr:SCO family protein [Polyangiaceae bacterium]
MFPRRPIQALLLSWLLCALSVTAAAQPEIAAVTRKAIPAERTDPLPKRLSGVDVRENLDGKLPLDVEFLDDTGKRVRLRDYFDGKLPVIITLNYSNCPMLCSMLLTAVVDGLKQVELTAGKDYRILTILIDPEETPQTASKTKARYMRQYGRPEAASGWHFLSGSDKNIRALAKAVGFQYAYNEERQEYVHPAAIALATPQAHLSRYLYGIEYLPKTLRLSLVEASEGKIGTTVDRLLLFCFHYDSSEGRYAPVARNIMRLGGGFAIVALGGFLTLLWRTELRKKRLSLSGSEHRT